MRYQPLGNSGLLVSVVGLGCNNFGGRLDLAGTKSVIDAAIDEGITLLDTADIYGDRGGSETLMGEALKGKRDKIVLATKWGHQSTDMGYGHAAGAKGGRNYIRAAVEHSLQRLQTDYIDLYQLHTPDPVTPIEETLATLTELVTEGKVRYIGTSNFAGWEIARAAHVAKENGFVPFISAQNHYSLLERDLEADVIPACAAYGQGMLPYFPLANGLLTGKVRRDGGAPSDSRLAGRDSYLTDDKFDRVEALEKWAAEHGRTLLEIAIAGLAAQPTVGSVIAGATKPEQVRANAAAGEWQPTTDELADIDRLAPTRRS
ncbi:aldo/keto reductase [Acidothermaceae bacterium B102]|nr:aldo/keto reductase [Acidothermaceae bacterium B102]